MSYFPVQKTETYIGSMGNDRANQRNKMIAAARQGDADAIESLTLEDIDTYAAVNQRILKEDLFSIVDTLFMPYGLECDHYQIMGNIKNVEKAVNKYTKETIYQLRLECNDMNLDVCINKEDLLGEPEVGRRFKGAVWLQGYINFEN